MVTTPSNYKQSFAESILLICLALVLLAFTTNSILFFAYFVNDLPIASEPSALMLAIAVFFGLFISYLLVIRLSAPFFKHLFLSQLHTSIFWIALSLTAGLAFATIILWLGHFFNPPENVDSTFLKIFSGGSAAKVLLFISVILIAPLGEEYLFRGALLSGLSQKVSVFWAILLSSVVFMTFHLLEYYGYWFALTAIFLLGVLLATIRLRSQSMLAPIICHASYNLIMLTLA